MRWHSKMLEKTQIVALDKTGTITTGEPRVTDILPAEGYTKRDLMQLFAADLESSSEHPLAKAVMEHAKATGFPRRRYMIFRHFREMVFPRCVGKICCSVAAFLHEGERNCRFHPARSGHKSWQKREKHRCFLPKIIPVPA